MTKCDRCEELQRELCAVCDVLAADLLQWLVKHGHLRDDTDCEQLAAEWRRDGFVELTCTI